MLTSTSMNRFVSLDPIRNQLISSNGSRRGCQKLCSGLAGEIDRPQVLFYPLIEFSNIPRYN